MLLEDAEMSIVDLRRTDTDYGRTENHHQCVRGSMIEVCEYDIIIKGEVRQTARNRKVTRR